MTAADGKVNADPAQDVEHRRAPAIGAIKTKIVSTEAPSIHMKPPRLKPHTGETSLLTHNATIQASLPVHNNIGRDTSFPRPSQSFPELPQKVPIDIRRTSLTVDFKSNPEVRQKFARLL